MNIIDRAEWGARAPKRVDTVPPSARRLFIVHYTAAPADQSVRAIQEWCMTGRGFSDIDYNFLVRGTTGETYEGRGWDAIGAHTVGHNTEGIGVCVISPGPISAEAKDAVRALYAAAVARSGHALIVKAHRELDQTQCPGTEIFRWVQAGGVTEHRHQPPRVLRLDRPLMHGADVADVQSKVGAARDGWYGPETEKRVAAWQKLHGLKADGIVGPLTRAKMGI
jgi:peptidoglycan hydrolase-like protein with peptidoglycan-binding domain